MRIGFIGTGSFARQHAEVLNELGVKIAACYGTNAEKTKTFANDFQCNVYQDPAQLISTDKVEALYIVIPRYAHDGSVELNPISKKIPFFCEKPIGLDLALCKNISTEILNAQLITSSAYLLRYEPLFSKIKEIINRNEVSSVRICSYSYMPEVHWWRKETLSGGMMVGSGSHYIDLPRYLFGEVSLVASTSSTGFAKMNISNCDIDDSMEGILKFQSGMIVSIGVTHLLNQIDARHDMLEVYGHNFALKVDLYKLRYKNEAVVMYKEHLDNNWNTVTNPTSKKELLAHESSAFLNAIQQKKPSLIKSPYPDALQSLKVALALNHSSKTNQFVPI